MLLLFIKVYFDLKIYYVKTFNNFEIALDWNNG